jgi:NAD+ synthase
MIDLATDITNWIREYCKQHKIRSLVIGVSGGVDSAVTSTLCARTGIKTYAVTMPIHQDSDQTDRGVEHIKWLQKVCNPSIVHVHKDLTPIYDQFTEVMNDQESDMGFANSRARLRMTTLYQIAACNSGIVVGTGNKVEDFGVGFYTKYGDGGVDISPIADLMKSEVRELGRWFGISDTILDAPPTDGLWGDGRTDEDQIGATYEELEWCMEYDGDPTYLNDRQKEVMEIYQRFNQQNKHKMISIPIFKKGVHCGR